VVGTWRGIVPHHSEGKKAAAKTQKKRILTNGKNRVADE